jgi:antibiotic biosynthesis monooxygenase (ABM) superfamily enzyme
METVPMPTAASSSVAAPRRPSRLSFSLALIPGAYVLITAILYGLGPLMEGWPIFLRTAVIVPLMVFGMVYGVIPLVQQLMASRRGV